MLEHESFFLGLGQAYGADRAIAFDPRVTVMHTRANRSAAYEHTTVRMHRSAPHTRMHAFASSRRQAHTHRI